MPNEIANRDFVIAQLRAELVGPSPCGKKLDITTIEGRTFASANEAYSSPFVVADTGEEIIQRDGPTKRYGVGVLSPVGTEKEETSAGGETIGFSGNNESEQGETIATLSDGLIKGMDNAFQQITSMTQSDENDFDLSIANAYEPSSMGVSFLAEISGDSILRVDASCGRYKELIVFVEGKERKWWYRLPVKVTVEFSGTEILQANNQTVPGNIIEATNTEDMVVRIELFSRKYGDNPSCRLVTVCLVNRSDPNPKENTLFQSGFHANLIFPDGRQSILPYPRPLFEKLDEEEKSLELLYRKSATFAVGHGCSATWGHPSVDGKTNWVASDSLPTYEIPSITPDVWDDNGQVIKVSMAVLAGLVPGDDGFVTLEKIVQSYEQWIQKKEKEIPSIEVYLQKTAQDNLDQCKLCAERMRNGIEYLSKNPTALLAFQLANKAILLQQIHSGNLRRYSFDRNTTRDTFSESYNEPDVHVVSGGKGFWRAFQIAFLLMSLQSSVDPDASDHEIVDLIWFPTGGGKTEAYLGLAAFSMFVRRLENPDDDGVHVIMRYTLRLLTTQQFIRASRLICAMEYIRRHDRINFGNKPFSIGLWVGGSNTPNERSKALTCLNGLRLANRNTQNLFVLDRCPWCGAQMGPVDHYVEGGPRVIGYEQEGNTVVFKCRDHKCEFHNILPISVIDEDLYARPPSMIIGTVDKFAMMTWVPYARSLFGIDKNGIRVKSPPGLIIQDELHLISGPLGSMVGLFETVIEELCTDRRQAKPTKPKLVCSTATIRRYQAQIKALYGRNRVMLFPPPGLEESDSFFSKYSVNENGELDRGRLYVGIHAPNLGSMQTVQVRTFTALLQSPVVMDEVDRDPWWTLLLFFNSLRELGTTLTLIQSDIPDYQNVYQNRRVKESRYIRYLNDILELTGRANSEDIHKAISLLERRYPDNANKPIDVCLASNILEVGIDIDRLSLMAIVGQPKTTSQYIQVTGRVGRKWKERPGLIVTIYSASKPRDRSHFEKFRSYHQRLYAQVEPTSVTPFSPPALDRALHAIMVAYVIQNEAVNEYENGPFPYPSKLIEDLRQIIMPRIMEIDPQEIDNFQKVFDKRAKEWEVRHPVVWKRRHDRTDYPLMHIAGEYVPVDESPPSWATMQSMRSVDAECIIEIATPRPTDS